MSESAPDKILDPVCGMTVDIADARERGLIVERSGREFAFCSPGCVASFTKDPEPNVAKVDAWLAERGATALAHTHGLVAAPEIDEGMRAWYSACRCCLSDAFPTVVTALDAERTAKAAAPADAGICETAESQTSTPS
ncbi:MAG: YHS domain-containing protein [Chloroflexota bacterium]